MLMLLLRKALQHDMAFPWLSFQSITPQVNERLSNRIVLAWLPTIIFRFREIKKDSLEVDSFVFFRVDDAVVEIC